MCGRIISYQYGHPDAFGSPGATNNIENHYIEGVSLTHGSPREHIWSFSAALDETRASARVCPCTNINNPTTDFGIPSFVGDDYFCETEITRLDTCIGPAITHIVTMTASAILLMYVTTHSKQLQIISRMQNYNPTT